jgi:hypothetical protein
MSIVSSIYRQQHLSSAAFIVSSIWGTGLIVLFSPWAVKTVAEPQIQAAASSAD